MHWIGNCSHLQRDVLIRLIPRCTSSVLYFKKLYLKKKGEKMYHIGQDRLFWFGPCCSLPSARCSTLDKVHEAPSHRGSCSKDLTTAPLRIHKHAKPTQTTKPEAEGSSLRHPDNSTPHAKDTKRKKPPQNVYIAGRSEIAAGTLAQG